MLHHLKLQTTYFFFLISRRPPRSTLFPSTTLFQSRTTSTRRASAGISRCSSNRSPRRASWGAWARAPHDARLGERFDEHREIPALARRVLVVRDWKSVVEGKRVDLGGRRDIKKKKYVVCNFR